MLDMALSALNTLVNIIAPKISALNTFMLENYYLLFEEVNNYLMCRLSYKFM